MKRALVIYFSKTDHTKKMAESIVSGIVSCKIDVVLKAVDEVDPLSLIEYDGIIIGSPCYFGQPAAEIKSLLDKSHAVFRKLENKVGGAFCSSGLTAGGNETTILSILNAFLVHGRIIKGFSDIDHYGPVSIGSPNEKCLNNCFNFGKQLGNLIEIVRE